MSYNVGRMSWDVVGCTPPSLIIMRECVKCSPFIFVENLIWEISPTKTKVLLIQQNQHCGDCSLKNWFTNCPSLINELLHCSFSGECPGFRRLFKALDGTPSVRPEPFHCFCHPAQSDRGLGKNGSFSRKSCKIYRFAEFYHSPEMSTRAFDPRSKLIRQLQLFN